MELFIREKDKLYMKIFLHIKENGRILKGKIMEYSNLKMVIYMKENLIKIYLMEKEN